MTATALLGRRGLGRPAAIAAAMAGLLGVAGCGSSGSSTPSPSALPSTSASVLGSGQATVTVAAATTRFDVSCTRNAQITQAIGNEGSNALTLTVKSSTPAAVLVNHAADGSTSIYQAIAGLRDDAAAAVGALAIATKGDVYTGTGVFVVTRIDAQGKRVKLSAAAGHVKGGFILTCDAGYAPPPIATASPK
jgi:hypothetical protein